MATTSPSAQNAPVNATIDAVRLGLFSGGDAELERVLLELFVATADGYIAALELAQDNVEAWRRTTHALKGASANIGAVRLAALARTAEDASPNAVMVRALDRELAEVRQRLRQHY